MTKAQILVVEDERIIAEDIRDSLSSLGYTVPAVAASVEEALHTAAQSQPDLVLMDIMLQQGGDGVEAARQLRERFNIPVVYLTAYADDVTLHRAKTTEPLGYLLKERRDWHDRAAVEHPAHPRTARVCRGHPPFGRHPADAHQ